MTTLLIVFVIMRLFGGELIIGVLLITNSSIFGHPSFVGLHFSHCLNSDSSDFCDYHDQGAFEETGYSE